ncbi:hypothetical protein SAMN05216311_11147 [Chitinophaga sp. CF418]|nr:hypothetical protein SAMN05216311_11147 [Chitinophaga sp. CF418]
MLIYNVLADFVIQRVVLRQLARLNDSPCLRLVTGSFEMALSYVDLTFMNVRST